MDHFSMSYFVLVTLCFQIFIGTHQQQLLCMPWLDTLQAMPLMCTINFLNVCLMSTQL